MLESKIIRVLIIATTKFEIDGITNVILNYYRAMDKTDMQIDFVIPNNIVDYLNTELKSNGSRIYKINGRSKNPILYVKRLSKLISENNYDIVHVHGNSCTLALEMYSAHRGRAKVRIPHSHNTTSKYKFTHRLLRNTFDRYYTHAFACGQKAGEWLYEGKPFVTINNGININNYKYNIELRVDYRNRYGFKGKKVVGHVGHFCNQKNHEFLIDIFTELFILDNNYRLLLIGDGEMKKKIEDKVNTLGLTDVVIFTGKTLKVPQLMQAIDMIIMPSLFEGLPLTLVEAQTACVPCFVSDEVSKEAGITNLVKFISLERSPKEWATIINESSPINREEWKEMICTEIIEKGYSITDNAIKMKEWYKIFAEYV